MPKSNSSPPSARPEPDLAAAASLDAIRSVLEQEAAALLAMAKGVDDAWVDVLTLFDRVRKAGGRIIVSGVGKSGHVGRKIAATFASTGTPSFFIHGTEASHGDLGMIRAGDAVLMLSASGGTGELLDLARHARATGLPMVLISKKADGSLGQLADHVLCLPDLPEACPNGQAPTTSSTATLAAGDALAVGLMRLAGFTAEDFRHFHPGGQLGQRSGTR